MGEIHFGVPAREVEWLKNQMQCETFIEGGTYKGHTAKAMSAQFETVVSIERHEKLHREARERIPQENISFLLGDTRTHLPNLLGRHESCILWLDAHWSGVGTYGEDDECPLLHELEIVFASPTRAAILIDDARLFLSPPPSPHKISAWPSLDLVIKSVPENYGVAVFEDVIYILETYLFRQFQVHLQTCQNATKDDMA